MCMQGSYVSLCVFLVSLHSFMLKVLAFARLVYRSSSGSADIRNDPNLIGNCSYRDDDQSLMMTGRNDKEESVFLQSRLISNTSKYQFVSTEAVSEHMKEPETVKFMVQEMFVGSNEVDLCDVDQTTEVSEVNRQEFRFKFSFDSYSSSDEKTEGKGPIMSSDIDEFHVEKVKYEHQNSVIEAMDYVEIGMLRDQDISYEVELDPISQVSACDAADSDDDDEYIVFEQHKVLLHEEDDMNQDEKTGRNELQENRISWDNKDFEDNDDDETDVLREHQDLVRQMKMELKNCRIQGLPTISEEHGSPSMFEDLKPFKVERKFEYKDAVEEIRKFYKIYAEKMRKFDILTYQALHAISFLELSEKQVLTGRSKKIGSTPYALPRIWKFDTRKIYADSSHRSISEIEQDLELIYVGQLCLSWEILSWSYIKARELVEYDSNQRSYNRVSEDFQQFQVLLQRFMEDEPFQGERTMCYVKRRCMIRNLLQVPMIKDDCYKDKKQRTEEADAISIEMLLNIIRESMRVFRDFLYADKRSANTVLKGVRRNKVDGDAKDSSNSRLLADIISTLHKKEKRVKESIRSQSCIIKKLRRQREDECRRSEIFMKSQVDLRLVSRVLSLPKITLDQILWCQMKLNSIGFVSRKVHVEPSFLLFPC